MDKFQLKDDSSRHAYLITAYNNFAVLENLLGMVDDPRNEIFVHIDRGVKNFDYGYFQELCERSSVIFVSRVRVHWGHYSQIESVFNLLQEATKTYHSHYHLLSGADLPIKSQDYIHDFCAQHVGKEFVGFGQGDFLSRVRWFYFFNHYRRPASRRRAAAALFFAVAATASFRLQRLVGVDRLKHLGAEIKKGSDWFSVTHQAALFLLAGRKKIRHLFRYADLPTEFYAQTLLWNSDFRADIFDIEDEFRSSVRHVDWVRGSPYVFRSCDLPELLASKMLFARKFDARVDMGVVLALREEVSQRPIDHPGLKFQGNSDSD